MVTIGRKLIDRFRRKPEPITRQYEDVPESFYPVLLRAYTGGFKCKSDFARENAALVAAAACEGYITTALPGLCYGDVWRLTSKGIDALYGFTQEDDKA